MRWATISIAPATPPRIWVNSSAKAAARLRPSDRVRSIAASLAVVIEAATVVHIARMTMTPTATISIVVARQRRRGSVGNRVGNLQAPRRTGASRHNEVKIPLNFGARWDGRERRHSHRQFRPASASQIGVPHYCRRIRDRCPARSGDGYNGSGIRTPEFRSFALAVSLQHATGGSAIWHPTYLGHSLPIRRPRFQGSSRGFRLPLRSARHQRHHG